MMLVNRLTIIRVLLLMMLFGIPGILKFDRSGMTHDYGLFNLQSISRICYYLFLGYITLAYIYIYERSKINLFWLKSIKTPFVFYILSLIIAIPVLSFNDLILSGYFIYEWLLFFIILYLYQKNNNGIDINQIIKDIVILIWLKIITLFIVLPIAPDLTTMGSDIFRLGGYFLGPNVLGTMAGMLAFYYYYYYNGSFIRKYGFFVFLVTVLILTNSRGAIFSFIIAYSVTLLISRGILSKIFLSYFVIITFILIRINMNFLTRGLDLQNILTLSERIPLWLNYYVEFFNSPVFGFGYLAGVKNLSLVIPQIHWVAPHAHNDFVQGIMSGGIIMMIFTLYIYYKSYRRLLILKLNYNLKLMLHAWLILIVVYAMLTPVLNWKLFAISGFLWMLYIGFKNEMNYENINCS